MQVNRIQTHVYHNYKGTFQGQVVKEGVSGDEQKGCKKKYLYGSLVGLGIIAAATGFYKIKKGANGGKKFVQNVQTIYKNGKVYTDSDELYSGMISRKSKIGTLSMACDAGDVVNMTYVPKKSKTVKSITRNIDTKTFDGVKIVEQDVVTGKNGEGKLVNWAEFTERNFPPELESVVKMEDFDKLGPRVVSKYSDLVMDYQGIYDLGNDYRLYVSTRANAYIYNGKSKMVRTSNGNSVSIVDSNNSLCTIKRDDNGKFQNLVIKNKHGIPIKFLNA